MFCAQGPAKPIRIETQVVELLRQLSGGLERRQHVACQSIYLLTIEMGWRGIAGQTCVPALIGSEPASTAICWRLICFKLPTILNKFGIRVLQEISWQQLRTAVAQPF